MSDKKLEILFVGEGPAPTGLDLSVAETWNPADGSADPAILATFTGARVFPMADDKGNVRSRVVIEIERWNGDRRGWWPGVGTLSQIFRAVGVRQDVAQLLFRADDRDTIEALAGEIAPALERLGQLEAYHVIAFEGTRATANGRDANVYRVEATRIKPGDEAATPKVLRDAENVLIDRARAKLGTAAGGGRDDL